MDSSQNDEILKIKYRATKSIKQCKVFSFYVTLIRMASNVKNYLSLFSNPFKKI